jgi:hypothetical protein
MHVDLVHAALDTECHHVDNSRSMLRLFFGFASNLDLWASIRFSKYINHNPKHVGLSVESATIGLSVIACFEIPCPYSFLHKQSTTDVSLNEDRLGSPTRGAHDALRLLEGGRSFDGIVDEVTVEALGADLYQPSTD